MHKYTRIICEASKENLEKLVQEGGYLYYRLDYVKDSDLTNYFYYTEGKTTESGKEYPFFINGCKKEKADVILKTHRFLKKLE